MDTSTLQRALVTLGFTLVVDGQTVLRVRPGTYEFRAMRRMRTMAAAA
jgi:hypothetical protein